MNNVTIKDNSNDERENEFKSFKLGMNPFYYTEKHIETKTKKYLWVNVLLDPSAITDIDVIIKLLQYKVDHIIYSVKCSLLVEIEYDEEYLVILHFKRSDGTLCAALSVNIADNKLYPLIKHFITEYAFYAVAVNELKEWNRKNMESK